MRKKIILIVLFILLSTMVWAKGAKDRNLTDSQKLIKMAKEGDQSSINDLLRLNLNVNETDKEGYTALHRAAENGQIDIVKVLISRGAQIDALNQERVTPLFLAVKSDWKEIARFLVENGADISLVDSSGNSPASLAINGTSEILESIVSSKNVNEPLSDGSLMLYIAAKKGRADQVRVLLEKGADPTLREKDGVSILDRILIIGFGEVGRVEAMADLIQAGAPFPKDKEDYYIVETLNSGNMNSTFQYERPAIHIATEREQIGMILYLIKNGVDINRKDVPGNTALHIAAREGNEIIVSILVENGADINVQDINGNTPLHESLSLDENINMIKYLLANKADPNITNTAGMSSLHMAIMVSSDAERVQILLNAGVQADARDIYGNTPFLLAMDKDDKDQAKLLLEENVDIFAANDAGTTPVTLALGNGIGVFEWFFSEDRLLKIDDKGRNVLHVAVLLESAPEILETLVDSGANLNELDAAGETPLHYAVQKELYDQAIVLLKKGANLFIKNDENTSPLNLVFSQGSEATLRLLEGFLEISDKEENTPLFYAVKIGKANITGTLLDAGADVNHRNKKKRTALHEAILSNSRETINLLLNAGVDINAIDNAGQTALHTAVRLNALESANFLMANKIDLNMRDSSGKTALHMATLDGNQMFVRLLIANGASASIQNYNGQTPLYLAARENKADIVVILLEYDPSTIGIRDKLGLTPLHASLLTSSFESGGALIDGGADIYASDRADRRPIDIAMMKGSAFFLKLTRPFLLNSQDNQGNTPLHWVVKSDADPEILSILLTEGANKEIKNFMGKTAWDLATELDKTNLAEKLSP